MAKKSTIQDKADSLMRKLQNRAEDHARVRQLSLAMPLSLKEDQILIPGFGSDVDPGRIYKPKKQGDLFGPR